MLSKLAILLLLVLVATSRKPGSPASCRGDSVWDGNRCTCGPNQINLNGKCVCDYTYWPNGKTCEKCDASNQWNGKPCAGTQSSCPDGCKWNGNTCAFDWTINNCGDGQYFNGKYCMEIATPVLCLGGYSWNQAACVPRLRTAKRCADTAFWDGKQCSAFTNPPVCGDGGWDSYTGSCIATVVTVPSCDSGKFWNGQLCTNSIYYPVCPRGCYWNSKSCIAIRDTHGDISCLADTYWNGDACVPKTNSAICKPASHWDDESDSCVSWGCKTGQLYDGLKKGCVDVSTIQGINKLLQGPVIKDADGNVIIDTGGLAFLNGGLSAINPTIPFPDSRNQPFLVPTPPSSPTVVVSPGTTSTKGGK